MALVRIVFPDLIGEDVVETRRRYPSWGTQIFIDGHELPDVRSIKVDIGLDHVSTVCVEMIVSPGSEIELPAAVQIEGHDQSLKE